MSIADNCGQIKRLANTLHDVTDVGSPLSDQEMVITLLGGFSDKLAHCAPTVSASRPLMGFSEARSFLQQEEVWITGRIQRAVSTALLFVSQSDGTYSNAPASGSAMTSSAPIPGNNNAGSAKPRKRKK